MIRAMIRATSGGVKNSPADWPLPFGELADQVLVAAADDVGLDVLEAQALLADPLDEVGEAVVVDVALAVRRGVEVHPVDDAFERGVGLGDVVQVGRQALADLAGELADDGPDGLVGVCGLERQVEADELVVLLDELERLGARADLDRRCGSAHRRTRRRAAW